MKIWTRFRLAAALCLTAAGPIQASDNSYIGEAFLTVAAFCPISTIVMEGHLLDVAEFGPLYSVIGMNTEYTQRNQFRVPILRDRDEGSRFPAQGPRWCLVQERAIFPVRAEHPHAANTGRFPGELITMAGDFCPKSWTPRTEDVRMERLLLCQSDAQTGPWEIDVGRAFLTDLGSCPDKSLPAKGQTVAVKGNELLFLVMQANSTTGQETEFTLPSLDAPAADLRWCIVSDGRFPMRP